MSSLGSCFSTKLLDSALPEIKSLTKDWNGLQVYDDEKGPTAPAANILHTALLIHPDFDLWHLLLFISGLHRQEFCRFLPSSPSRAPCSLAELWSQQWNQHQCLCTHRDQTVITLSGYFICCLLWEHRTLMLIHGSVLIFRMIQKSVWEILWTFPEITDLKTCRIDQNHSKERYTNINILGIAQVTVPSCTIWITNLSQPSLKLYQDPGQP